MRAFQRFFQILSVVTAAALMPPFACAAGLDAIGARPLPRALELDYWSTNSEQVAFYFAETGLFDVYKLKKPGDPTYYHVILADGPDCLEKRNYATRFTAATGFRQCGQWGEAASLPADRIRVRIDPRIPPRITGELPGPVTQTLVNGLVSVLEGGKETVIHQFEFIRTPVKADPPPTSLEKVVWNTDTRIQHSMRSAYRTVPPISLDEILRQLGHDPSDTHVPAAATATQIEEVALDVLANKPKLLGDRPKQDAVLDLLASLPPSLPEAGKIASALASSPPPHMSTLPGLVEVEHDCWRASAWFRQRSAVAEACTKLTRQTPSSECGNIASPQAYREICLGNVRDAIWAPADLRGIRVLVADTKPSQFPASPVTLSTLNRGIVLGFKELVVPENFGMLDVVLSQGNGLWRVSGAVGCVVRLTVISEKAAVLGLPPSVVQFRFRIGADHLDNYNRDSALPMVSKIVAAMLEQPPELIYSLDEITDLRPLEKRAPELACRDTKTVPMPVDLKIDDLVTEPASFAYTR